MIIVFAGLIWAVPAHGQTSGGGSKTQVEKPAPKQKPTIDIDSFFEKAEKQTRKAQEKGDSNCVPKPKAETPVKPVV